MEDSPSGLWRTLGKRVGVTASRVRISYPPPGLEPRKPLKTFGFRGFALVPSDCRFPPGSLRVDTFGPDLPRVSHIGTDDSENAFEPSPAACPPSKPDPAPRVPSVGRFESLHVLRAVFSFWFATIPASVFCQVVIGQCGVSFPSEKAVGLVQFGTGLSLLVFYCFIA